MANYFEGDYTETMAGGCSSDFNIRDNRLTERSRQERGMYIPPGYAKCKFERCPTCGGMVVMPCQLCKLNGE